MYRTVSYYIRVVYNLFRLPMWSLLNFGRIRFKFIQKLAVGAKLSLGKLGQITIGNKCMLEKGVLLRAGSGKMTLGDNVFFNRNSMVVCNDKISIGSNSTFGPNVCIYDHNHDIALGEGFICSPVTIGERVWVGANVVILKGVTIGNDVVIGAGTVVTKDVPDNAICVGPSSMKIINQKT